jgi:short-subunit dehydrogenase
MSARLDLRGRCVVLTGAAGGIGAALTAELVEAGAQVLAIGRDGARLHALAQRFGVGAVVPLRADVADAGDRARIVAQAQAHEASVLVLAHAQSGFGVFADSDAEALRAQLETNLVAPTLLTHALLPQLRAQAAKHPAAVVALGSTFGALAFPGFAAYSASKHGLRGLIEALRREHADTALRFQYFAPRATRTAFNSPAVDALNAALRTGYDSPETVARALCAAIVSGAARTQMGRAESVFVRLNALLPRLIDRNLAAQWPLVRQWAAREAATAAPIVDSANATTASATTASMTAASTATASATAASATAANTALLRQPA